jgi:hypothetical protein
MEMTTSLNTIKRVHDSTHGFFFFSPTAKKNINGSSSTGSGWEVLFFFGYSFITSALVRSFPLRALQALRSKREREGRAQR